MTTSESLKKDLKSDYGIGIPWLWQLPATHPFHESALWHDNQYDKMLAGLQDKTLIEVDRQMLAYFLEDAGDSLFYKAQAYAFFAIAHAWGLIRWKGKKY